MRNLKKREFKKLHFPLLSMHFIDLVILLLQGFGDLNCSLRKASNTRETKQCGHTILRIFAQLFSLWINRDAQKGTRRSWCLGAKRIWIKPATNRALPYPISLSRRKEMQVLHLGTRKKPRTVSRHPDIGELNAVEPIPYYLLFPSFRVATTSIGHLEHLWNGRFAARRSSVRAKIPSPSQNILFVPVVSWYYPESLRAISPMALFPVMNTKCNMPTEITHFTWNKGIELKRRMLWV